MTTAFDEQSRTGHPERLPLPAGYPRNRTSTAYGNSILVKSGVAKCFGFQGYNSGAAQFVLVFDAKDVPSAGAIPVLVIPVAATSLFSGYFGSIGRSFDHGIVLANSSTGPTLTIGAADCWFDVQYV